MKRYRAKVGIYDWRIFYEHFEMENICLNALRSVNLLPASPSPIRIDRFVEKKFGINAEYDDLPDGTLGFTKFGRSGVERIVVTKSLDLDQSISSSRRINTTLAHESGHGLFHSTLFNFQDSLFEEQIEEKKILCRDELRSIILSGQNNYNGEWWEYQANVAIGALLLPRPLAEELLEQFTFDSDLLVKNLDEARFEDAVMCLSETFDVNPAVARIRVREIFPKSQQQSF